MSEYKTCLPVELGGCGKQKSIEAFPICKGKTRRPRCKECHSVWQKRPPEEREAMRPRVGRPQNEVGRGEKRCLPPNRGGCGMIYPLDSFYSRGPGRYDTRCTVCSTRWKRLPLEVRQSMQTPEQIKATERYKAAIAAKKPPEVMKYSGEGSAFFNMPATDCERDYARVGL